MRAFVTAEETGVEVLLGDHGGVGTLEFRRLMVAEEFSSAIEFVDYTLIPPGSTIGLHQHSGNEELYLIVSGVAVVTVEQEKRQLTRGSIGIVRSGQSHELKNDGESPVAMFVVQVSLTEREKAKL